MITLLLFGNSKCFTCIALQKACIVSNIKCVRFDTDTQQGFDKTIELDLFSLPAFVIDNRVCLIFYYDNEIEELCQVLGINYNELELDI